MKTFTARELNRSPAAVLAAAERDGVARIRSRNGRSYSIKPEPTPAPKIDWDDFVRRRREALKKHFPGGPVMTRQQAAEFDELLRSDGIL